MNTMADGAAQRLVAQIGEALFGQPGLTLMELAEKVKASRGNPAAAMRFTYRHPDGRSHDVSVSSADVAREMDDFLLQEVCSKICQCQPLGETNVIDCCCNEDAEQFSLIAAQPSPAGQGDASGLIQDLRAAVSIGRPILHSDVDEIEAALAARQSVGQEPVGHLYRVVVSEAGASRPWAGPGVIYTEGPAPFEGRSRNGQYLNVYAAPPAQVVDDDWHLRGYAYASKQATTCAGCGEHKHTPLRIDAMGGYVCLTCIDKKLSTLLGEFGYEPAQAVDLGQFRRLIVKYRDSLTRRRWDAKEIAECDRLLAVIDSQAVGNG